MRLSSGRATYASQAPFGQTRAGCPSIVTAASPLPAVPKRKLESRTWSTASGGGYTTLSASGPRTGGTAGNSGDGASDSAGARAAGEGVTGAGIRPVHAAENEAAPREAATTARALSRVMAARYTLTETYDKRTLTLPRGRPRFVTLPSRRMESSEGTARVTFAPGYA